MAWVSPTGDNDPDAAWGWEFRAWDDDEGTKSTAASCRGDSYLELTHAALNCDKVRILVREYTELEVQQDPNINLDVFYGVDWHNIFSGVVTRNVWVEKPIGSTESVTAMRIALVACDFAHIFWVFEADFNEVEVAARRIFITHQ